MKLLIALAVCACHVGPADTTPDATDTPPEPDATCGGVELNLTYTPPNLGVVLDRSCSMTRVLQGTQITKWQAAVAALDHVLASYPNDVRWGLTLYPDTTGLACAQDANTFPIGVNNAPGIAALLDASLDEADVNYPKFPCKTNTDTGVASAAADPALAIADRPSYLMLITDGGQSAACDLGGGDAGSEATLRNTYAMHGVATFVIGFGSEVDHDELTRLAIAGGVPSPGATAYYSADTAAALDTLFAQVANQVVSCTYTVDQVPPDLDRTYVIFEHTELVPRDPGHVAGWDYDPLAMAITMYGAYCDRLRSHTVSHINVVFGCPAPPIL